MVSRDSVIGMLIASFVLTSCGSFSSDFLTPPNQTEGTPAPVISPSVQTETPQPATTPTEAPDYVQQIRNEQY